MPGEFFKGVLTGNAGGLHSRDGRKEGEKIERSGEDAKKGRRKEWRGWKEFLKGVLTGNAGGLHPRDPSSSTREKEKSA